jgi:hypothetical protein
MTGPDSGQSGRMSRPIFVRGSIRSPLTAALLFTAVLSLLTVTAVACSSSNQPSTTAATTPRAESPATSAPASSDTGLSGTWSGKYSGAFTGTFTLIWQQSGSKLSGTIHLSSGQTPHINGTVNGDTIRFGTVGSTAITYSGSISGNSMSGTYKVQTPNGSVGGPWSADKSS